MLGDVSPALLPEAVQQALVDAVEQDGLGLVVQCGTRHMPWDFAAGPLAEILPMHFDATSAATAAAGPPPDESRGSAVSHGLPAPAFAPFRMVVTPAGARASGLCDQRQSDAGSRNLEPDA